MEKEEANGSAYVHRLFQKEMDTLVASLRRVDNADEKASIIARIDLIRYSQKMLKRCFEYSISPLSSWRKIPETEHAFSEYRLLEDFDSDDRKSWKELEDIRPSGGAVIIG